MPIQDCQVDGRKGKRWGKQGKCYVGPGGLRKALRQARAIKASQSVSNEEQDDDALRREGLRGGSEESRGGSEEEQGIKQRILQGVRSGSSGDVDNSTSCKANSVLEGHSDRVSGIGDLSQTPSVCIVNRTQVVPSNPLKADPTRTATLRRKFQSAIWVRFARLRRKIVDLVAVEDAFGLRMRTQSPFEVNTSESPSNEGVMHHAGEIPASLAINSKERNDEGKNSQYSMRADCRGLPDCSSDSNNFVVLNREREDESRRDDSNFKTDAGTQKERDDESRGSGETKRVGKQDTRGGEHEVEGESGNSTPVSGIRTEDQHSGSLVEQSAKADTLNQREERDDGTGKTQETEGEYTEVGNSRLESGENETRTGGSRAEDILEWSNSRRPDNTFSFCGDYGSDIPLVLNQRWAFRSDAEKLRLFQEWLKAESQLEILAGAQAATDEAYWQAFVEEGYRKGAGRAFDDTRKAALASGTAEEALFEGTRLEFLRSSFARPVAVGKVKLLAGRVFTDLKGVTEEMNTKMTRILAEGLAQGQNPAEMARTMIKDGMGFTKTRGIQSRAMTIARTEIIRAHATGQLDAMEDLGVTEVGVMVEWSTAGDDIVCPLCSAMGGVVLKIKEARGLIPRHPSCRCAYVPSNVGESTKGQKRGKAKVRRAMDDSVRAEMPKVKKRTLAEQKRRSTWAGADRTVAKVRPKTRVKPAE